MIKAVKVVENLLSDVGVRLRVTRSEMKDCYSLKHLAIFKLVIL
jgi:hypothetical protein